MDITTLLLTEGAIFVYHLVAYILIYPNMTFRRSRKYLLKVHDIATIYMIVKNKQKKLGAWG